MKRLSLLILLSLVAVVMMAGCPVNAETAKEWDLKGMYLYNNTKYGEALEAFDQALNIDSEYVISWNHRGGALLAMGKYDESIKAFDQALELDPNFIKSWCNKGKALLKLGKYDEAIDAYDQALKIDPEYSPAISGRQKAVAEQPVGNSETEAAIEAPEKNPADETCDAPKDGCKDDGTGHYCCDCSNYLKLCQNSYHYEYDSNGKQISVPNPTSLPAGYLKGCCGGTPWESIYIEKSDEEPAVNNPVAELPVTDKPVINKPPPSSAQPPSTPCRSGWISYPEWGVGCYYCSSSAEHYCP